MQAEYDLGVVERETAHKERLTQMQAEYDLGVVERETAHKERLTQMQADFDFKQAEKLLAHQQKLSDMGFDANMTEVEMRQQLHADIARENQLFNAGQKGAGSPAGRRTADIG